MSGFLNTTFWHRETIVWGSLSGSVVASMKIIKTKDWDQFKINCCSSNLDVITADQCQNLFGDLSDSTCDVIMEPYCKIHTDDKKCSCYNVPTLSTNTTINNAFSARPDCYYDECSIYGYKPNAIAHKDCTSLTICSQDLNTQGNKNIITNNIQTINCGMSSTTPSSPDDTTTVNVPITNTTASTSPIVTSPAVTSPDVMAPVVTDTLLSKLLANKLLLFVLVIVVIAVAMMYLGIFNSSLSAKHSIGAEYEMDNEKISDNSKLVNTVKSE